MDLHLGGLIVKKDIRGSNQYKHKNAKIIHPKNPNDPLIVEAVTGSDFELDLKDPQIRKYFKNGTLNFVVKGIPKKRRQQD